MSDKREKGSITVEAALFIPLFFFAFMCIFSLISCVRAQVLIQYSVDQAAKEVAEYSYILEKTGVLDAYKGLNSRSEEFQKQMQDIKSNLEVIEDTAKRVSNGQGTIQNVVEAGKAGKATADQLKEYKENPKEFVNGVLDYLKNTGWNKLAGYMTGVVGKACLKKQLSIASGGQDADEYLEKLGVTNMKFRKVHGVQVEAMILRSLWITTSKRISRSLTLERDIIVSAHPPVYGQAADRLERKNGTFKKSYKRKKIYPADPGGAGSGRRIPFQQIWLSLAESSAIYDINCFYGFSWLY